VTRLNKYLSEAGIASRRKADLLIEEGKVFVNGRVAKVGVSIDPQKDHIKIGGKPVERHPFVYIMLHKSKDALTTRSDPEGRKTIYDLLPTEYQHLHPIGRLDRATTGLLILTNDGDLTERLAHPRFHVLKVYKVTLNKPLELEDAQVIAKGIELDGVMTKSASIHTLGDDGLNIEIAISEGRYRQVRRMFEARGYEVVKLKRTHFGPLDLGRLPLGKTRPLLPREIDLLKKWRTPT
jgi:23S rRNA pseudouridine2605 synthase